MNPSTASTSPLHTAQHAAPSASQVTPPRRDELLAVAAPTMNERNPAQTDDSPDAILGYN